MAVERSRWTDTRIDELAERVMRQDVLEARFDALERGFAEMRAEMREMRAEMRGDVRALRVEMTELRTELRGDMNELRIDVTGQINTLRSEFYDTRRWLLTMWLTGVLALLAIFIEISLRT